MVQAIYHLMYFVEVMFQRASDARKWMDAFRYLQVMVWLIPLLSGVFLCRLAFVLIKRHSAACFWVRWFRVYSAVWIILAIGVGWFMYYSGVQSQIEGLGLQDLAHRVELNPNVEGDPAVQVPSWEWQRLREIKSNTRNSEILDFSMVFAKLCLVLWWLGRSSVREEIVLWNTPKRFTQYPIIESNKSFERTKENDGAD